MEPSPNVSTLPLLPEIWSIIFLKLSETDQRALLQVNKRFFRVIFPLILKTLVVRSTIFQKETHSELWRFSHLCTPQIIHTIIMGRLGTPYFVLYDGVRDYKLSRFVLKTKRIHILGLPFHRFGGICSSIRDGSFFMIIDSMVTHVSFCGKPLKKLFKLSFTIASQIALDHNDNLMILPQKQKLIKVYSLAGQLLYEIGPTSTTMMCKSPHMFAVAADNRSWVLSSDLRTITILSPTQPPQLVSVSSDCRYILSDGAGHMLIFEQEVWSAYRSARLLVYDVHGELLCDKGTPPSCWYESFPVLSTRGHYYVNDGSLLVIYK